MRNGDWGLEILHEGHENGDIFHLVEDYREARLDAIDHSRTFLSERFRVDEVMLAGRVEMLADARRIDPDRERCRDERKNDGVEDEDGEEAGVKDVGLSKSVNKVLRFDNGNPIVPVIRCSGR